MFLPKQPPKYKKSNILSRGFIDIFENAEKSIFKNDDTSNEKRRGLQRPQKNKKNKNEKIKFFKPRPRREHQISGARVIRANVKSRRDDPMERGRGEVNLSPEN